MSDNRVTVEVLRPLYWQRLTHYPPARIELPATDAQHLAGYGLVRIVDAEQVETTEDRSVETAERTDRPRRARSRRRRVEGES